MCKVKYQLWEAGADNMRLYNTYNSLEEAKRVAISKRANGQVGTINIYKVEERKVFQI